MTQGPRFQIEPMQSDDSTRTTNVVFDPTTGNLAIDYSVYLNRIASATEELVISSQATQSAVEEIRDIINGTQEVTGAGIPFKDAYAGLSMSTLIKTLEEEKVNINNLIAKTKGYLDSV